MRRSVLPPFLSKLVSTPQRYLIVFFFFGLAGVGFLFFFSVSFRWLVGWVIRFFPFFSIAGHSVFFYVSRFFVPLFPILVYFVPRQHLPPFQTGVAFLVCPSPKWGRVLICFFLMVTLNFSVATGRVSLRVYLVFLGFGTPFSCPLVFFFFLSAFEIGGLLPRCWLD